MRKIAFSIKQCVRKATFKQSNVFAASRCDPRSLHISPYIRQESPVFHTIESLIVSFIMYRNDSPECMRRQIGTRKYLLSHRLTLLKSFSFIFPCSYWPNDKRIREASIVFAFAAFRRRSLSQLLNNGNERRRSISSNAAFARRIILLSIY